MLRFKFATIVAELYPSGKAYAAFGGKYSFLVVEDNGWWTSWQDQEKGGSASSTLEGPFKSRDQAEDNCRRIFKALKQKQ